MKHPLKALRVRENHPVKLRQWPTAIKPVYLSKEHYGKLLAEQVAQLSKLQRLLYARAAVVR